MKVLALIFDGFEELEAVASFALLRRAKIELDIASYNSSVKGSHNIVLTNILDINHIDYKNYDALLIPGGPHFKLLRVDTNIHEIIRYFMDNNKVVATICAGPTILGMLGYLKGKNYTCFTSMNQDFGGTYHDAGVIVDGNLITSRSAAYSIDFAYEIVKKLLGLEALEALHKQIYYEK